jgi:hypothetical protein
MPPAAIPRHRAIEVAAEGHKRLHFDPPLAASDFRVSVLPKLDGPGRTCAQRVQLVGNGDVIATLNW